MTVVYTGGSLFIDTIIPRRNVDFLLQITMLQYCSLSRYCVIAGYLLSLPPTHHSPSSNCPGYGPFTTLNLGLYTDQAKRCPRNPFGPSDFMDPRMSTIFAMARPWKSHSSVFPAMYYIVTRKVTHQLSHPILASCPLFGSHKEQDSPPRQPATAPPQSSHHSASPPLVTMPPSPCLYTQPYTSTGAFETSHHEGSAQRGCGRRS